MRRNEKKKIRRAETLRKRSAFSNPKSQKPRWAELEAAYRTGDPVTGHIFEATEKALHVDLKGVVAILPRIYFYAAKSPGTQLSEYVGQSVRARVVRINRMNSTVTLLGHLIPPAPKATVASVEAKMRPVEFIENESRSCRFCGAALDQNAPTYFYLCEVCYEAKSQGLIRGIVQGGIPGLPKRRTLRICKRKEIA